MNAPPDPTCERQQAEAPAILIVEDEIFVALDLERILTRAGYRVAGIAADRATALGAVRGCGCAIALIDINLRDGRTGPAIAEELAREHGVNIVFVTANPAQIGTPTPAIGYVRKPFTEDAILAAAAVASGAAAQCPPEFVPISAV